MFLHLNVMHQNYSLRDNTSGLITFPYDSAKLMEISHTAIKIYHKFLKIRVHLYPFVPLLHLQELTQIYWTTSLGVSHLNFWIAHSNFQNLPSGYSAPNVGAKGLAAQQHFHVSYSQIQQRMSNSSDEGRVQDDRGYGVESGQGRGRR